MQSCQGRVPIHQRKTEFGLSQLFAAEFYAYTAQPAGQAQQIQNHAGTVCRTCHAHYCFSVIFESVIFLSGLKTSLVFPLPVFSCFRFRLPEPFFISGSILSAALDIRPCILCLFLPGAYQFSWIQKNLPVSREVCSGQKSGRTGGHEAILFFLFPSCFFLFFGAVFQVITLVQQSLQAF